MSELKLAYQAITVPRGPGLGTQYIVRFSNGLGASIIPEARVENMWEVAVIRFEPHSNAWSFAYDLTNNDTIRFLTPDSVISILAQVDALDKGHEQSLELEH